MPMDKIRFVSVVRDTLTKIHNNFFLIFISNHKLQVWYRLRSARLLFSFSSTKNSEHSRKCIPPWSPSLSLTHTHSYTYFFKSWLLKSIFSNSESSHYLYVSLTHLVSIKCIQIALDNSEFQNISNNCVYLSQLQPMLLTDFTVSPVVFEFV